jgi:hypothetical protein
MTYAIDEPVILRPDELSFEAIKVNGKDVLMIKIHTGNIGTIIFPVTPLHASILSDSLASYAEQIARLNG